MKNRGFYHSKLSEKEEREIILSRGRKYLKKCLISNNTNFFEINTNPILTTIIPSYNSQKTISTSIHSIQYQNYSNIEIIVVDDFSTDNVKQVIKNMQLYDKRIKLIENKKNMGTLYTRCIGALLAQGSYIFSLDNDDFFFDEDVFDFIYREQLRDNLDLVSFRILYTEHDLNDISKMKDYFFYGFRNNLYLSQPKLGSWTLNINGKFRIHDNEIWSKSIKTNIYKKAVNMLGIQRYSKYVCWAEDTNINFIIFNIAQSFKYIHKFGYIHILKATSATFTQNFNNKLFGELFFLDVMFDFSKNTSVKNYVVSYALYLRHRYRIIKYTNNTNCYYLKTILYKIINCQFITKENIKKIINNFNSFIFYNNLKIQLYL